MKNSFTLIILITALMSFAIGNELDHASKMASSQKIFSDEVRGILIDRCVKCHGGKKTRSGFNLTTREELLLGGDQGVAVIAGEPNESPIIKYLRHTEEPFMPPKESRLPDPLIEKIEKWIALGAAYDKPLLDNATKQNEGPMEVTDEDRSYWAFAPLKTDFPSGAKIDDYVKTDESSSPRTLARRLYFDLTGLPPSPEEVNQFVNDNTPESHSKLVDRLLESKQFGERWARHWLDIARFAESHGFEQDYDRNFAFHYRDFVIRAFNENMPYDQFVRWQIAGDELAPSNPMAMMATGFLGAGVFPTQITISEAERVRYDAMDDMLATMGSAMLATTIGCARCHDHKYDPIPTKDYYRMLSAFTNTVRSDINIDIGSLDNKGNDELTQKIKRAKDARDDYANKGLITAFRSWNKERLKTKTVSTKKPQWDILSPKSLLSQGGATFSSQSDGSHLASGKNPAFDKYTFITSAPTDNLRAFRLEALAHKSMKSGGPGRANNGNIALSDLKITCGGRPLKLANPRATFEQHKSLSVSAIIDDNAKSAWAIDPQFGKDHAAIFEITNPQDCKAGEDLVFVLKFENNTGHNIGRLRLSSSAHEPKILTFSKENASPEELATNQIDKLIKAAKGKFDNKLRTKLLEIYKPLDEKWRELDSNFTKLESEQKKTITKVMVCSDGNKVKPMRHHTSSGSIPNFYKQTHFLKRGDTRQKGEIATLSFLQVLTRGNVPRPEKSRSAIADWITDSENGAGHLLARVIVNRIWQHYLGKGIVATPNDFGFQGERPNNPALLDWLAHELIDKKWNLKHIHRTILNSDAYRAKRMPRRLEAEAIRDNALAVSELMDKKMYGAGTLKEEMLRRSIYFKIKRTKLVPIMQSFDWPDSLTSLGKRSVTTTPSQALIFINDPNMRRLAEGFAKRISGKSDPIKEAYQIAYGRLPSDIELSAAVAFIEKQQKSHDNNKHKALSDFCGALMSANEFIYIE
ncbi:PSD1 and planctomycete cytochrome C domain-containing protein [Verrucomicrobia bacterium]|nr:PSD1 and planctomycete cytochrome C domain-containing protein [Verrucomicrobiota bacterium]